VGFEALAVLAVAPFLLWTASRSRALNPAEKAGLAVVGVGTLAVDGYLLYRYLKVSR
jgi:hypothetical protein